MRMRRNCNRRKADNHRRRIREKAGNNHLRGPKEKARCLLRLLKYTSVWNPDVMDYKNKYKRDAAWLQVASSIDGRDEADCTAKWNALRTNYRVSFYK